MKDTYARQAMLDALVDDVNQSVGLDSRYEFRFHPTRKWRFDVAWPKVKVALEVEGGAWQYGRHNRAASFLKDMEKYNEAAAMGWVVLRCPWEWVEEGQIKKQLVEAIRGRKMKTCRDCVHYGMSEIFVNVAKCKLKDKTTLANKKACSKFKGQSAECPTLPLEEE